MKFETLSDVLEWIRNLPVSQADTSPATLFLKSHLPEDTFDQICAVVESQCWHPIYTLRKEFIGEREYYNDYFLMYSSLNGVQKVSHGFEDDDGKDVWLFADGCVMKSPTHWMFVPQPPKGM